MRTRSTVCAYSAKILRDLTQMYLRSAHIPMAEICNAAAPAPSAGKDKKCIVSSPYSARIPTCVRISCCLHECSSHSPAYKRASLARSCRVGVCIPLAPPRRSLNALSRSGEHLSPGRVRYTIGTLSKCCCPAGFAGRLAPVWGASIHSRLDNERGATAEATTVTTTTNKIFYRLSHRL